MRAPRSWSQLVGQRFGQISDGAAIMTKTTFENRQDEKIMEDLA